MDRKAGIIRIVISIIIAILSYLIIQSFNEEMLVLGYAGVFLFSLFSSASVMLPVPSWSLVLGLAGKLNPLLLGLLAGIGSAIGELTGYLAGEGGAEVMEKKEWIEKHKKIIKKYEVPALFLLAFIPNPLFDMAGIAAGALKISIWRFFLVVGAGKSLRFIVMAYLGKMLWEGIL